MPTLRRWRQEDRELQPFVLVKDIKGWGGVEQGREGGRERRREGGRRGGGKGGGRGEGGKDRGREVCFVFIQLFTQMDAMAHVWGLDNDWQELVISFYHVGSGD